MFSEDDESQEENFVNYKQKYRELKKHLRALIYENECFQDELRKAQRNFVSISRDKSFLLDRLLTYEKNIGQSSDSDVTESSEEDGEQKMAPAYVSASFFGQRKKITKRKRSDAEVNGGLNQGSEIHHSSSKIPKISTKPMSAKPSVAPKKQKKPPSTRKPSAKKEKPPSQNLNVKQILKAYNSVDEVQISSEEHLPTGTTLSEDYSDGAHKYEFASEGQMTREDIERHLEARRFSPEMELNTTATVPAELFSQDPDHDSDLEEVEEDATSADMMLE